MNTKINKNALVVRPGSLGDLIATIPVFLSLQENQFNVYLIGNEKVNRYLEEKKIVKKAIGFGDIRIAEFFSKTTCVKIPDFPDFDIVISYIEKDNKFSENLLRTFKNKIISHPVKQNPAYHITRYLLQPLRCLGMDIYYPLPKQKNPDASNILFIHPGSGSKKKNWQKEKFARVFHYFNLQYRCKIILGECEIDNYEFWEKNAGKQNLIVPDSISDLSLTLETGRYFIGNDSGVSHLASFLGLKCFIIFGPTDPEIWAPIGNNVRVIRSDADCSPCTENQRNNCAENLCLKNIKPEHIISVVEREIEGGE